MMETPKGILRAEEIAGSHPRLACSSWAPTTW